MKHNHFFYLIIFIPSVAGMIWLMIDGSMPENNCNHDRTQKCYDFWWQAYGKPIIIGASVALLSHILLFIPNKKANDISSKRSEN